MPFTRSSSCSEPGHSRRASLLSHRRALSSEAASRNPNSPTQVIHTSILPHSVPTPALLGSAAKGAHYSGARADIETPLRKRFSSYDKRSSHMHVKDNHQQIIADLKELYECRPTREIFERSWRKDAVFEDPLSQCHGYREYAAQWFAMPKTFSRSETVHTRIMSSTLSPNRLVYAQTQDYTFRWLNRKKRVESIVIVDMDDDGKIMYMSDRWDGKPLPTRFGASLLRKANAKVLPWFVKVPERMRN